MTNSNINEIRLLQQKHDELLQQLNTLSLDNLQGQITEIESKLANLMLILQNNGMLTDGDGDGDADADAADADGDGVQIPCKIPG